MKGFSRLLLSGGICLILFLIVSTQVHADMPLLQQASSYSVLGPPTVSAAFINQVLASNHSPAAGKGQALFDDGVNYGIDPVFALAFFMHESSFGSTGIAQYTLSLGNERCIAGYPCYNGFTVFPTWEAGFIGWYSLIRNLYIGTWNLSTVEEIIPTYAPSSDHNNVAGYINAVESAVDAWRSGQISAFGSVSSLSAVLSISGNPYPSDQYSIVGKPTVTVAFINQVLTQYHSPAVGKGQVFYDAGVKYGIDPIYALAFFMRDSTFGTIGLARATRSLGPLPMSSTTATASCHCQDLHGYRSYATWDASITDWFHYMHDYYVKQMGLTTVSQVVSIYLKTNDTLAIQFAIKAIESRVDLWRKV